MADLIPMAGPLNGYSDEELLRELTQGLTLTAQVLTRLGSIWMELERRGRDLSHLRTGLPRTLPLIAAGVLAAEAVVSFANRPSILRALEGLPLARQRALAAGEPIEVALDAGKQSELVPIAAIPFHRLRFVIQDGRVLSPAEQRVGLVRRKPRAERVAYEEHRFRPRYEPATGIIHVGRMRVRLVDLLRELAGAAGPETILADQPDQYLTVKVRVTREEMERLLNLADKSRLPEWELVRKALRAFGVI